MFSFKSIVLIAAAFTIGAECSGVAVAPAPLLAPAAVGYAQAVPQNIPPYAAQVSVVSKALNPVVAAPFAAAPYAAAPYAAAPFAAAPYAAAPFAAAPYAAGPYFAGAAPVLPGPYAAPAALAAPAAYAAPYPYAASPLVRAGPFGYAPAYVR
ncbi:hypothetical protein PYW07_013811 [Mythimna separata]|uniref:Uncharacterized protein n=1 Tax=Mythimna separata TaxID=271217 RepID=A0AAD7YEU2_MYTSE|nr:hypothetical protein PYW07_013811 [Mythimna separata]